MWQRCVAATGKRCQVSKKEKKRAEIEGDVPVTQQFVTLAAVANANFDRQSTHEQQAD